jgi:hypothetical protein
MPHLDIRPPHVRARRPRPRRLALLVALACGPAWAGPSFTLDDAATVDTSLTLSYTSSMRTAKPASEYLADLNNDDGTRNFKRYGLINNRANLLGEIKFKHDNLGGMLRGSAFYDSVYRGSNDNDSPATVNKTGPADEFVHDTRRLSGQNSRLLEAFVYGNWLLGGEHPLSVKLGRHAVVWGESMFWPNISQGQVPVDATKFNVPGTEAKEAYLPVGQLSASLGLTDALTVTGYYQYKWEKSRLNPVGDYFGSDYFGPGAQFFRLAAGPVSSLPDHSFTVANFTGELSARDSGQWGLGTRYQLSDTTELGLFHYRYHDRVGALLFDFTGSTRYSSVPRFGGLAGSAPYFQLAYFEDIKLTGLSLSTKIGDSVQLGGDLSYRDGAPVYLDNGAPTRGRYVQGYGNFVYMLGPSAIAHQTTLMGEVAHQRIAGADTLTISGGLPTQNGDFNRFVYDGQTRSTTVGGFGALFDYPNLFSGWDLSTKVIWTQNLAGSSFSGMGRDERRLTLGADFKYLGNLQLGLTYVGYIGSPNLRDGRTLADRDYLSFNAKYTF